MAEIKSAIELAMEKTKGLVMDREERAALTRKDVESRIRATLRRYQEGMIDNEGVVKELSSAGGDANLTKTTLLDALIEGFDVRGNNEKIFALFHLTGIGLDERLGDELERLQNSFTEEMEKRKMIINARIEEKLTKKGITGNGLEPNIEAWDDWQTTLDEVARIFQKQLEDWKKRVAESVREQ